MTGPTPTPGPSLPDPEDCACGQPVRWVTTAATGTRIPINPDPDPDRGNQLWMPRERVVTQLGTRAAAEHRAQGMPLYLPHIISCTFTRSRATPPEQRGTERRPDPASSQTREAARAELAATLAGRRRRYRW